jgi:rhamnosyltransferase
VHCLYLHRKSWGLHWVSGLLAFLQVLRVLQYEPQKVKKITAITCGYLDGLFGLLGTFEDRHPSIAAFCKRSAPTRIAMDRRSSVRATGGEA